MRRRHFVLGIGLVFGLIVLAVAGRLSPTYYTGLMTEALILGIFAVSLNLLLGHTGLPSLGHSAYFGVAGYTTAILSLRLAQSSWVSASAGIVVSVSVAAIYGLLALRTAGVYFMMITLALAQMLFFFYLQTPFTHGEDGIQSVPRGVLFGVLDLRHALVMYYVVLAIFLGGFLLIYRVVHSPFGQVLKAIRENESRAISLGYDVDRYKLLAFVLSAALAGLAGATKAIVFQLASLTDVHWTMSGEVVLMTLLGGMGTIFGPVVGAFVIISLENYLSGFGEWVTVITGAIFVVCVLAFRRGIVGELAAWWEKHKR